MNDIWTAWLEDNPSINYFTRMPQTGSKNFLDYWQNSQNRVYNDYMGTLGRQAINGQDPTLSFTDFLQNLNWNRQFNLLSPASRGYAMPRAINWNVGL